MKEYYDVSSGLMCEPEVRLMQLRLNSIRNKYHYNWELLEPDGLYGPKTKAVVMSFQKVRGITPASGILGPTTIKYIIDADSPKQLSSNVNQKKADLYKDTAKGAYEYSSRSIVEVYKVDSIVNPEEKGLARIFEEWGRILKEQEDGLLRRISKFPAKKQMRARNVAKQLEFSQKFITNAKRYGINTATVKMGNNLNKETAIKYIKEVGETISNSGLTKGIRAISKSLEKIKQIIKPVINTLNKIPGLKYLSVIEKLVKATQKMLQCEFENALGLYLDALRELLEQIIIDAAVVAAIALGGWIALVIVIVIIIGSILLDYFFFSDNPGESLADKHLNIKTHNVVQEQVAPWAYQIVN